MSAPETRGSVRRPRRWIGGLAAVAAIVTVGFGLLAGPANATDGNSGSVDTSTTTVTTDLGAFTDKDKGGDDQCTGDKCERYNWCDGRGANPHPGKLADDAPIVLTKGGDKGDDEPRCIKRPKIDYKCCVVTDEGNVNNVVVTNRAEYPFKIKVQIGDSEPQVQWVKAGETAVFTFQDVKNGEHELVAAVWAGGRSWCVFKKKTITVDCPTPTTPSPSPSVTPSASPSVSTSPSVTPSASTSTTPAPGGGGGDNEPQLPVTGASLGWVMTAGVLLVLGGSTLFFVRRRRPARFTA